MPWWGDAIIAVVLFATAAVGGYSYWKRATVNGQPFYYQLYFEPAVMVACGHGFVVARPQVPEMVAFLRMQVDRFSCSAITPQTQFNTEEVFQQGSWRYLMLSAGYTWRLLGVSWRALGPLFAVLFAATVTAGYGIFRLGMGPLLALAGSAAFATAGMHLKFVPSLRDYSKAPMTLVLIFLLGSMVLLRRTTWPRILTIAALYGAVLAIGYGFRTDFMSDFPPFFLTLFLFLPGGVWRNLPMKAAAAAVCIVAFLIVGWPIVSTLARSKPGCQWHVVVMGFAREFSAALGVGQPPYDISREYLDEYVYTTTTSAAARVNPAVGHIEYCEPEYGAATRAYLIDIAVLFPGDVVTRALSSIRRVVALPFSPVPGWDDEDGRQPDWSAGQGIGIALAVAALVVVGAANVRVGLFVAFFLLYFGGLPAVQFSHRHFFHLVFVMWWAAGFLLHAALVEAPSFLRERGRRAAVQSAMRGVALVAACAAVALAALWAARLYQQPRIRGMLNAYVAAPRDAIPRARLDSADQGVRVAPHTDPETADVIVVDVRPAACRETSAVAFRYDDARRPYGRVFPIPPVAQEDGLTEIFMPIYDGFGRLDLVDAPEGCVDGVYRLRDPRPFPMLLEARLDPGWRRRPLYQQFAE